MSDREPKAVMHKMLQGFIDDPPDNDFQRGYLEGLVVFAHDVLGMRMQDPIWRRASEIAYGSCLSLIVARQGRLVHEQRGRSDRSHQEDR